MDCVSEAKREIYQTIPILILTLSFALYYLYRNDRARAAEMSSSLNDSSSSRLARVSVRHGRFVNRVDFEYAPSGKVITFGNSDLDPLPTDSIDVFTLTPGEKLIEVRGRMGNFVDAIEFVLSSGRAFGEYGSQNIDHGSPFSFQASNGRSVLGIKVTTSVRGWLRSVEGLMYEIPKTRQGPRSNREVLHQHRNRLRTRWQMIWIIISAICVLCLFVTRNFFVFTSSSSCTIYLPDSFTVLQKFQVTSEPRIGNLFPRKVRYVAIRSDQTNEIVLLKQHANENTQTLSYGYFRNLENKMKQHYPKKNVYIDTTQNALSIAFVLGTAALGFLSRSIYVLIVRKIDPFRESFENVTTIHSVMSEVDTDNATLIRVRDHLIVITPNFLLKLGSLHAHAVAIRDIILPERPLSVRTWIRGERVDVVTLKIVSRRFSNMTFQISILREQYRALESFVSRIRAAQAAIAKQRSSLFLTRFVEELKHRQNEGHTSTGRGSSECLGACGHDANVKIVKRCESCTERTPCHCTPSWCHRCILKWWISQNQTKLEMELPIDPRWQARCPTCRAYFCLDDVLPCAGTLIYDDEEEEEEEN